MNKNITFLVGGVALGALAMYMYNVKTSPASVGTSSPEGEMSEAAGRLGVAKAQKNYCRCCSRKRLFGGVSCDDFYTYEADCNKFCTTKGMENVDLN